MKFVNVHEAKTTLSQLLAAAEQGEDVVIGRNGVMVARLVPIHSAVAREPGLWRAHRGWDSFVYDPSVLAPLSETEVAEEGWL